MQDIGYKCWQPWYSRGPLLYPDLWKGCVGAWHPGIGASGNTLIDFSGYGNHGTLNGTGGANNLPQWVPDQYGLAMSFDGTDDYVTITDYTLIEGGIDNLSMSLWFKTASTANYRTLIEKANVSDYELWVVGWPNLNQIHFIFNGAVAVADHIANEWTHLGFSWSKTSGVGNLYINGGYISQLSSSSTFTSDPVYDLVFGYMSGFGWPYPGLLDDVRIYNRALTAPEIAHISGYGNPALGMGIAYRRNDDEEFAAQLAASRLLYLRRCGAAA